jgi:hypothetical protein
MVVVSEKTKHGLFTVYNLTVNKDHTYYVGKAHGGIWVHNTCPGGKPRPDINGMSQKNINRMNSRGWDHQQINEAFDQGTQEPAVDLEFQQPATRYLHPSTGKSLTVNDLTGRIVMLGDKLFKYDIYNP